MFAILRVEKHSDLSSIRRSGRHKDREQDTPNADPALTPTNETQGAQTAAELVSAVQARVDLATVKATGTDKPVLAVEYLITASPEFFKVSNKDAVDAYFERARTWLREKHGADNVVSITRHNDEKTPHLSAFVVPLVEHEASTRKRSVIVGRDEAGKPIRETREYSTPAAVHLSAKHFFGDAKALSELQTDFHSKVGKAAGLERGLEGSKARHTRVSQFYANLEYDRVTVTPDVPTERAVVKKGLIRSLDMIESDEMFAVRVAETVAEAYQPIRDKAALATINEMQRKATERTALEYRKQTEPIVAPFRGLSTDQAREVLKLAKRYQRENEDALRQEKERKTARPAPTPAAPTRSTDAPTHPTGKGRGRGGR